MNETSQNGKDRELLTIRHMRKAFGDNQVLKDISLSVRNGEIVSVIGPSGSGNRRCCGARPCWKPWMEDPWDTVGSGRARQPTGRAETRFMHHLRSSRRSTGASAWCSRTSTCFRIIRC